ncbi:YXWGXW repeat-containing protein [Dyella mobilis]|uniref:YXWGXW repeat-containing protein n=1 Tax=Dyella mobilis TaxID=1849582 RepID=A0ABS2KHH6_9GAMM|nr:YXWGXW repeat-containing protein [Dyella mobilis]MBM7130601.1 YXWGXW repeat-containing protein [Dyella mobilis]GLQ97228.1 hypothetical protein GCM10007863_16480 [Dyella mobilis]
MKRHAHTRNTLTRCCALALGVAGVFGGATLALWPTPSQADAIGIGISITLAPPPLPVYVQPPMPDVGYIWTPGYWAWGDGGYYWVPGTWVMAPFVGALWTPGYWGWSDGVYLFHEGYWGTHVGFYGGINYGYGYSGEGYAGGRWGPGGFYYNRSVNSFGGVHVTNVYNQTVVNNVTINHVSYNGGNGGVVARPTPEEAAFAHQQHTPPVAAQQQHVAMAAQNQSLRASVNHGNPSIAATSKPAAFSGPGVMAARGAGRPVPAAAEQHPANLPNRPQPENRALPSAGYAPHPNAAPRPGSENERPMQYAPQPRAEPRPEPARPEPREQPMQPMRAPPAQQPYRSAAPQMEHPAAPPPRAAPAHAAPPAHPAERGQPPKRDDHRDNGG